MSNFAITAFLPQHSQAVVNLWRQAHSQALGLEPIHSVESQTYFLQHILPQDYVIQVVLDADTVVAFMACNCSEISQLYVHPDYQGKGIGSLLMQAAKQQSDGYLSLRTFEKTSQRGTFTKPMGLSVQQEIATTKKACQTYCANGGNKKAGILPAFSLTFAR